ncbi:MAG: SlyX family protein [Mangrovicoccus sp.]
MDRIDALEEKLAYLDRAVLELSDLATEQMHEIERLGRVMKELAKREVDRDPAMANSVVFGR